MPTPRHPNEPDMLRLPVHVAQAIRQEAERLGPAHIEALAFQLARQRTEAK